jgi:hypothetical protein
MIRPADHLRGGRLPLDDQAERDRMVAELYQDGERQVDIADAFMITRASVNRAVLRAHARIPLTEVAQFRKKRWGR